jgi:hypothetical protein
MYDTVVNVPSRLANIKNFTLFYEDLANNKLPQWYLHSLSFLIMQVFYHS